MKLITLTAISAALLGLGCTISPNVVAPESAFGRGGALYNDCRRASRDVCSQQMPDASAEKACVANKTYDCVRGGSS